MTDSGSFPGPPSLVVSRECVTGWFFGGRVTYFEMYKVYVVCGIVTDEHS